MSSSRRKVLFLIPSLGGGGAERVFSLLLAHLDRSRFELHLALLQAGGVFLRDIPPDVMVHDLQVSRVRHALSGVVRLVWEIRPDALLSTMGHLNIAVVATRPLMPRGTRILIREAVMPGVFLQERSRHPQLWRWLYRHFYRRADRVVCLSEAMVHDLMVNFRVPRERLVRIYNPVDVEKVRRLAESAGNPYSGPGPHLVSVGRLSLEKGVDVLIDAMPAVLEHFPDAQLTILGEGLLLPVLLEQSKRLSLCENVHFVGFQTNPWRYMRYADVFVLPSRVEGLPNALLEALVLGTRVVASDCPGAIRELQSHDTSIALAPSGNPPALAEAIIVACKSPLANSESQELPQSVMGEFDLHQVMGEYSKLLLS